MVIIWDKTGEAMIKGKLFDKIAVICIVIALIAASFCTYSFYQTRETETSGVAKDYEASLFDDTKVMSVNIRMDEKNWNEMLENATKEEYYSCDVEINGTTYKNVGIRPKGNTSLTQIASDDTTDRYSFKLDFDKYVSGQTCEGLDTLILNNIMSDATYMKEYLSYDLLRFIGVDASLTAFSDIKVNGENWGLYLAIEGVEQSFAERNFGTGFGQLYKPESERLRGDRAGKEEQQSSGGADLAYNGDDSSEYSDIFDNAVFKNVSDEDENAVIEALKNLNEGTNLEEYIDVDEVLRYIAGNVTLVNLDSYFGTMLHNYYLYEQDGKLSMIPWDYNLAFAGFQSNSASDAVNLPIDTVVSGANLEERPMIAKLLAVDEYKEKYHSYLKKIVEEYFENGYFEQKIEVVNQLISSYVKNDATAFYTYDEYEKAVQTLKEFGLLRAESIKGQLDGSIPSIKEEQETASGLLVDASKIQIKDMGTQGGDHKNNNLEEKMEPLEGKTDNTGNIGQEQMKGNDRPMPPEGKHDGKNMTPPDMNPTSYSKTDFILIGGAVVILVIALIVIKFYKRRKYYS
ncbi:CotH kinase family protein [Velocimicrobium porci]|uniref:Spore coat protein CotH n=1 Tax=Velocimicrobium porci TaxID=2606634 RepID=A0A6L5XYP6_9FIRM|nr:CotH kinase family protein [Velocimicrobium porci]MSS63581.1 spore coat protein CotH [Velocimicrobium porci]